VLLCLALLPFAKQPAFALNILLGIGDSRSVLSAHCFHRRAQPLLFELLGGLKIFQTLALAVFVFIQHALPLHGIVQHILDSHSGRFESHHQRTMLGRR
jgi:hypothetical protein